MPIVELLCLANSKKHGGRCVAGMRTDGGGWMRPVAPGEDGGLLPEHYLLPDGSEPRIFDLLRIEVSRPVPLPHQPENWLVTSRPWELLARPMPSASALLRGLAEDGPLLFGSLGDHVPYQELVRSPARASLAVIAPRDLKWHVTPHLGRGRLQARAHFRLGSAMYDLPITDPACLERLSHLSTGTYPSSEASLSPLDTPLLTISLGEPYNGQCYKLVAAVIGAPEEGPMEESLTISQPQHTQHQVPTQGLLDPHLAEFLGTRHSVLGRTLVDAFSRAFAAGQTEDEAVQRLRSVLDETLGEEIRETAGH